MAAGRCAEITIEHYPTEQGDSELIISWKNGAQIKWDRKKERKVSRSEAHCITVDVGKTRPCPT